MIHLAMALLILSLTCLGVAVASFALPGVTNVSDAFVIGSVVATTISGGFTLYIWREGL